MVRKPTEERRRQIAQAALEIIAEDGLGKFTTAAIASRVGLSDGALFRHFKSKKEIVLAAIDLMRELFFEDYPQDVDDPLDRLGLMLRRRLSVLLERPFLVRLMFSRQLAQASGGVGQDLVGKMQARTVMFIRDCLEDAKKRDMLNQGVSVEQLTLLVHGFVFAVANREMFAGVLTVTNGAGLTPDGVWHTLETLIRR